MRSSRVPGLFAVLVLFAMLIAGCGGDDKSSGAPVIPSVGAADNLISQANLVKAVDKLKAEAGREAKATTVRIDPRALTATVSKKGKLRFVIVDAVGKVQSSTAPTGATATFPLSDLDPAVPDKLVAGLGRFGKKLEDIDYVVLTADPFTGSPSWNVFVRGGVDGPYQADLDGSNLNTAAERAKTPTATAPGGATTPVGPATPSGGGGVAPPTTNTALPPEIAKVQRCVLAAGSDAGKAAECIRKARVQK